MNRRMYLNPVAIVLAVLTIGSGVADARRLPTKIERAGVHRVFKVPAKCSKVYVSTVDRRYASYEYRDSAACRRYGTNGIEILKRTGNRWRAVGGFSDCSEVIGIRGVPARIFADLSRVFCTTG